MTEKKLIWRIEAVTSFKKKIVDSFVEQARNCVSFFFWRRGSTARNCVSFWTRLVLCYKFGCIFSECWCCTVGIWNPDMSRYWMVKERFLSKNPDFEQDWNLEAWPFKNWLNWTPLCIWLLKSRLISPDFNRSGFQKVRL